MKKVVLLVGTALALVACDFDFDLLNDSKNDSSDNRVAGSRSFINKNGEWVPKPTPSYVDEVLND